ncbi:Hypothetical predicted protein [Pelobates cultripes]|uniref:Uncharacterized protein n=1 Tax=Pelobates cultripes TaxID=61616 RepID=A0AAD1SKX6_PELCU|nr:Hypothetical predicted protein [Pelobates cultripes]
MSQQKGKKIPDRAEKSGFFTARSAPSRAQGQHEADQDGGGDDILPLHNSPDPGNLPVTQEFLIACLDKMSDKLLNKIQASVTALGKDIQELGERTAHVENRMGEYEEAHNDLTDHVKALEQNSDGDDPARPGPPSSQTEVSTSRGGERYADPSTLLSCQRGHTQSCQEPYKPSS